MFGSTLYAFFALVTVTAAVPGDEYGLDGDGDGWGCEQCFTSRPERGTAMLDRIRINRNVSVPAE